MKKLTIILGPSGSGKTSKMYELAGTRKFRSFDAEAISDNQFLTEGYDVVGFEGISSGKELRRLVELSSAPDTGILVRRLYSTEVRYYKVPELIATIFPETFITEKLRNNHRLHFIDLSANSFKKVH